MNPNLTPALAVTLTPAPVLATMSAEGLMILKAIGILGLLVLIPLGILLFRNQDRWFGRHCTDNPHESNGSLTYGRTQCWLVYIGLLHLTLWLTFGL